MGNNGDFWLCGGEKWEILVFFFFEVKVGILVPGGSCGLFGFFLGLMVFLL